ncbi:phage tail spike protein [Halalkalibacterium halodurans]|uniref:phage tail spike protein n=1 Tax=Halalkalibacterium halodurans TaxID=86665 RepID=UPI002AA996DB|nr:phage tail spike protein [Halalkalibacterium halodurans]MDY7224666.1 phage tail spike protein [Halalkalibacterium halodurans]MDY7243227.1 phage tail spike protein [Halalkalibacterium halodurans]
MTELYIFDQDDKLLTIINEETGLLSTQFREELNHIPDTPFTFSVEADVDKAKHIVEENQVVFRDTEGDLRLFRIKEIDDQDNIDGPVTTATCEPACMELNEHIVVDRRFVDKPAQEALDAALQGTRWTGNVEVELSTATTNFYYISSIEAIWNILEVWGGDFKDVVTFDSQNNITSRQIRIKQRLGADHGKRFEIDHNTTEIGRTVLSYPVTALYGRGASLPIEDDEGEHTGGYTRYIDFADVVWSKSKGDPVDKPKGQRWVGDPNALKKYGYLQNGKRLHRYGIWQNQDIEDPAELLRATWEQLEEKQKPEINYRLSVDLFDKKVSLGDTARAIDRQFARPIEIQARVVAVEYDLLDVEGTMVVEMGQLLNLDDDRLDRVIETINRNQGKWDSGGTITNDRFPNIKPATPVNVEAHGGFKAIQLYWDYDYHVYISHYEVYGSQVKDFVPDSQHLLWRGRVSGFVHEVDTDQVWYYRVRAVNYHDRPSDWSEQVSAATVRIISDDILFGPDLAEHLRELNRISDIIGEGGVDFENISEHARNLLEQEAKRYTDEEINLVKDDLLRDISDLADDLQYIDGQLVDKVNVGDVYLKSEIDGMFSNTVSLTRYTTDMAGVVQNLQDQRSLIEQNADEIRLRVEKTEFDSEVDYLNRSISDVRIFAEGIESTVSNIQIGGTNLLRDSNFTDEWKYWVRYTGGVADVISEDGVIHIQGLSGTNGFYARQSVNRPTTEAGQPYTVSIWLKGTGTFRIGQNNVSTQQQYINSPDNYSVFRHTFTPSTTTANPFTFYGLGDCDFYVKNVKVEQGNKGTDWSPSPEDTNQRMTQAESRITQLANEIELKVDVDGIVSAINLSQEGIRIKGSLIHLDGLTLIDSGIIQTAHIANAAITRAKLGTAVIGTAQIENLAVTSAKIASVNADKINAASLSAISANLGTVTAGILRSSNNTIEFNLNQGTFDVYNDASIRFHNSAGGVRRIQNNRSAILSFPVSAGSTSPMVAVGAVTSTGTINVNDASFRGIRIHADNVDHTNDFINDRWTFSRRVDQTMGSIIVHLGTGTKGIFPQYTGSYNYDLGTSNNKWRDVHVDNIRSAEVYIRNPVGTGGWIFETQPESGSSSMTFRGINSGVSGWNYNLGTTANPFNFARINHLRPQSNSASSSVGSSSERYNFVYTNTLVEGSDATIKKGVVDSVLGLSFVKDLRPVDFVLIENEQYKTGLIAQEVANVLDQHGVNINEQSIVTVSDTVMGISYTQLIAPTIKAIQELDTKLENEVNWLKVENQLLRAEIKQLKEKIA